MKEIDYTRHYKNWHDDSHEHVKKMISFYKNEILQHFPKNINANVLEIGCGMGFLLLTLQEEGYKNTKGIDIDKGQIQSAKK
jgi:2-polyprenyl-3-methyl-5-hydroxy-6-metoxy-1,4-benzoquinol methylase